MGFSNIGFFSVSLVASILISFLFGSTPAADVSSLVYKGCAKQTFTSNSGSQETLTALFNSLVAQASGARFFKSSSGGGQTAITGLFQCRGDLSNADCNSCVRRVPEMASNLCGQSVAGRVQLTGCYLVYQTSGFPQISGTEMLYKMCSSSESKGAGFEEKRDIVFNQLQTGISGGSGFYATTYSSVYAIAQCEGDLGVSDCGSCIKVAVQRAQVECGTAIAGQIYLSRCYMSYSYYPNGLPGHSSSGQQTTGKTVAIVVGGAAALGFVVICLLFVRSVLKKRDDY
ncbi:plasmodesmata-located protein 2-like [Aristolochia californica]|uniref:plasmodesmata-located protein 2-like n=1 Tax=Aristolochia californica TaxID=171875 RepID=UPI0035D8FFF5